MWRIPFFVFTFFLPTLICTLYMLLSYSLVTGVLLIFSILFMLSSIISTLELGCYGRPALKQSFILVTQNKCRVLGNFSGPIPHYSHSAWSWILCFRTRSLTLDQAFGLYLFVPGKPHCYCVLVSFAICLVFLLQAP